MVRDSRLLIHKQCGAVGFFVSYMIIKDVSGQGLVIRPPIVTLCGCPRTTRPREYYHLPKQVYEKVHTKPIDQSTLAAGLTIAQFKFISIVGIHVKGHWLLAYTSLYPIVPSASSL